VVFRCRFCQNDFAVYAVDCPSCQSSYSLETLLTPPNDADQTPTPPVGVKEESQEKEAEAKDAKQTGVDPAVSSSSSPPLPAESGTGIASGLPQGKDNAASISLPRRSSTAVVLTDAGYRELLNTSLDMARELLHKISIRYVRHEGWWGDGVMERDRVIVSREHARVTGYDPIDQADMPRGRSLRDLNFRVSKIIRHDASRHRIAISSAGWVSASDLLWAVRHSADRYDRPAPDATYDNLWYVFKNDASRYQVVTETYRGEVVMRMVRAITGHSCREIRTADLYADRQRFELSEDSPQYIFHGTYLSSAPGILEQGG
jgi:hypothetical protein